MKILVISDVHVGEPRLKNEDRMVRLLEQEDYEVLVLNGDFLDTWMPGYKESARSSQVIQKINSLNDKNIVWVRGNHDEVSKDQIFIPRALVTKHHIEFSGDKKLLFVHGHQVYFQKNSAWWTRWAAKLHCWWYRWTGIDLQIALRNTGLFEKGTKRKRNLILKKYKDRADIIIIGHTHVDTIQELDNTVLYDCGSLMLTETYVYIKDGKAEIRKIGDVL